MLDSNERPFDFLAHLGYSPADVNRMNLRHRHIVSPIEQDLRGARVLDLGSHDGRWPFALAKAGAAHVLGIEGREELIAKFSEFPDPDTKKKVQIVAGDFLEEMRKLRDRGETFDVVACLGVFYHTMHHYQLLILMCSFRPKVVVVDSLFHLARWPMMGMSKERVDKPLNTISQAGGQAWAPIGHVSRPALEIMAESLSYSTEWIDWNLPEAERIGVKDYFEHPKNKNVRRFTAVLRPM